MLKLMTAVWTLFQHFWKVKSLNFLDGLTLMLTAIINPIYLLCLILFDINVLFLVSSHINVEQFLGSCGLQKTA